MTCFEALTEEEIKAFYKRVEYAEDAKPTVDPKYLFRYWNKNKDDLFNMLGKKLIIEKEIEFNTPKAVLKNKMWTEVCRHNSFIKALLLKIDNKENNIEFYDSDINIPAINNRLYDLTSSDMLVKNKYDGVTFYIYDDMGKKYKIESGCKVMRALRTVCKAYSMNEKDFEAFRLKHSMCLNNAVQKGTLCLSIHPLDFSTMSDNNSNWTSCMAWTDHRGEYRMGTVEMMNSPCVIIGYLKSKNDMYLTSKFSWNDKKWRCLFIVDDDVICTVKAYPYHDEYLERTCLDWIKELKGADYYTDVPETFRPADDMCSQGYYYEFSTGAMYSDMYGEHTAYVHKRDDDHCNQQVIDIYYSGETECMVCGVLMEYDEMEADYLACGRCVPERHYCVYCGSEIDEDDICHDVHGEECCSDCFNEKFIVCSDCRETIPIDDSYYLEIHDEKGRNIGGIDLCECCYDNYSDKIHEDKYGDKYIYSEDR